MFHHILPIHSTCSQIENRLITYKKIGLFYVILYNQFKRLRGGNTMTDNWDDDIIPVRYRTKRNCEKSSGTLKEIELELLRPFKNHPFNLYTGKQLEDLTYSIKQNGIMQPIHIRPAEEGKYEILSGHNRVKASKEAGLRKIPSIIHKDMSDEDAAIFVVDSNLNQRSHKDMKASEFANSLYMLNEATKKKSGYRSDKDDAGDGSQADNRIRTMNLIGDRYGLSQSTIARYIRLAHLIKGLQEKVDNKKISKGIAVQLSYLSKTTQQSIEELLEDGMDIDIEKAKKIYELSELSKKEKLEGILDKEKIAKILVPKKQEHKVRRVRLNDDILSRFFPDDQSHDDIQDTITKALELYYSSQKKK